LRLVELLVIALVVEFAMALPMAVYFHRITLFALPVNLFILPLLVVLMPLALLTLLALLVWPAAAVVPAMGVAAALHIGVGLVRHFGSLSLGDFRIATPLLWQSATWLTGALLLLSDGRVNGQLGLHGFVCWLLQCREFCLEALPGLAARCWCRRSM
jgi:competence protein ComEC